MFFKGFNLSKRQKSRVREPLKKRLSVVIYELFSTMLKVIKIQ